MAAPEEDNRTLSTETAEALLKAIKDDAPGMTDPESLKFLAEAYALVNEAMPKRRGQARAVVAG